MAHPGGASGSKILSFWQDLEEKIYNFGVQIIAQRGLHLQFTRLCPTSLFISMQDKISLEKWLSLEQYISELLPNITISKWPLCPCQIMKRDNDYFSSFLLVRKTSRKWRPQDSDSKLLLKKSHCGPQLRSYRDWMVSVDLKNVYFYGPIARKHQRYLRFHFNDSYFNFLCLLFDLRSGPNNLFEGAVGGNSLFPWSECLDIPLPRLFPHPSSVQNSPISSSRLCSSDPTEAGW